MLEHTDNFYQTSCHTPSIHMIHSADHMIQVKVKILGRHQVAVKGIPKVLWWETLSLPLQISPLIGASLGGLGAEDTQNSCQRSLAGT